MQPSAALRVLVDVDSTKATKQLALFDANLKKTAATTSKTTGEIDTSSKSLATHTSRVKEASSGMEVFEKRVAKASRGVHLFHGSLKAVKMPGIIASVGVLGEASLAAAGGVTALTGALAPVTGLAASAGQSLFAFGQIAGVIATAGVGDAAKAVGGLNEKLDEEAEAFKSLSPAAQEFARSLDALKPTFRDFQEAIQEPLFESLTAGIKEAKSSLPTLQSVLTGTSEAIGQSIERVAKFIGSADFARDFAKIGEANNKIIGKFGNTVVYLGRAFMDLTVAARPLTKWLSNLFQNWAKGLSEATQAGRESGGLAAFFEQTKDVTSDLLSLFGDLGGALWDIMKLGAPLGREILDRLVRGAENLREWTESVEGENKIKHFFEEIEAPIMQFGRLLRDAIEAWFHLSEASSGTLAPMLKTIRKDLLPAFTHMAEVTSAAFGPRLIELLTALATHFAHLAGTSGPLNLWVEAMTGVTNALNWMIEHVPGFQQVMVTLIGLNAIAKSLTFASALSGLTGLVGVLPRVAAAIGTVTLASSLGIGAMEGLSVATGIATGVLRGLMIATGIGALITAVILLETKFHFLEPTLKAIGEAAKVAFGWIKTAAADAWEFLQPVFHRIGVIAVAAWEGLKTAAKVAWDVVMAVTLPARKFIEGTFEVIKVAGKVVWGALKVYAAAFWGWLKLITLPARKVIEFFFDHIKEIGKATWDVLKFAAKVFWDWLMIVTWPARKLIVGTFNLIKTVGMAVWGFIKEPAKAVIDWLVGAWQDAGGWIEDAFRNVKEFFVGFATGVGDVFSNMIDGILGGITTLLTAVGDMLGTLGDISIFGVDLVPGAEAASDAIKGVTEDLDTFREGLRSPEELAETFDIPLKKAKQLARFMDQNPGLGAADALEYMANRARAHTKSFADRMGLTVKAAKVLKDFMDKHPSLGAKEALAAMDKAGKDTEKNFPKSLKNAMDEGARAVDKGGRKIEKSIGQQLGRFGIKGPDARQIIQVHTGESMGPGLHTQRGGYIAQGAPMGDSVPAMLERGEYVLNRKAVAQVGKSKLDDLNFAMASRFQAGGMVDPAGPGTGIVNQAIAAVVGKWSKQYDAAINYGYDPGGGHRSPGHNVTGTATDTGPASGWAAGTPLFEKGLRAIEGKVDQILYGTAGIGTAYPDHGRGNHAHIEWGMHPDAVAGAMARFKLPRFMGAFVQGKLGAVGLNKQAAAMEKIMARRVMAMGGGSDIGSQGAGYGKSDLMGLWRQQGGPGGASNLAAAVALAESGGDPNATNLNDNGTIDRGLWQINSIHGALSTLDPFKNAVSAIKISDRGSDWTPWVTYNEGLHTQFLQRGGMAGNFEGLLKTPFTGGPPGDKKTGGGGKTHLERLWEKLKRFNRTIAELDEKISIAETRASFEFGPFGAEMGPSERDQIVGLYERLFGKLKDKRGLLQNVVKMLGGRTGKGSIVDVRNKASAQIDRLLDRRQGAKPKDRERIDKAIEKLQRERDKELEKLTGRRGGFMSKLSEARSQLQDVQGLTGKGGRIFETRMALAGLRGTALPGTQGISIQDLLRITEVARLGLPIMHGGGMYKAPTPGGSGLAVLQDREVVSPAGASGNIYLSADIYIGNEKVGEIVNQKIKQADRKTDMRRRAGV